MVDCVLLTRFDLPSGGDEQVVRAQEGWLRNRWELFERYCVPSVVGQTDRALTWIAYFDPLGPEWLAARVAPLAAGGVLHPVRREQVSTADLLADIAECVGPERGSTLTTTNLDNDDALAADFVARLRAVAGRTAPARTAVYFEDGLIRSAGRLYVRRDPTNAFCSVAEPWEGAVTCWTDWHNRLADHMPVHGERGAPAWLQVVHGQNVSNRVRGRLTAPVGHRARFPGMLDDLDDPGRGALARDALVDRPARAARDAGVRAAKRAVQAVAGDDGWTRAKQALRTRLGGGAPTDS